MFSTVLKKSQDDFNYKIINLNKWKIKNSKKSVVLKKK